MVSLTDKIKAFLAVPDSSGDGSGYGDGSGDGYGDSIKSVRGLPVHDIDGVATAIEDVPREGVARGYVLHTDLTLTPCFVVKEDGRFAHGATLREAFGALQEKLYADGTEDERLARFRERFPDMGAKYPAADLFAWHHVLTGSCRAGREAFCRDHGIDVGRDTFTIPEFVALTRGAYGGGVVARLMEDTHG